MKAVHYIAGISAIGWGIMLLGSMAVYVIKKPLRKMKNVEANNKT